MGDKRLTEVQSGFIVRAERNTEEGQKTDLIILRKGWTLDRHDNGEINEYTILSGPYCGRRFTLKKQDGRQRGIVPK
jgi:hypothetical protein